MSSTTMNKKHTIKIPANLSQVAALNLIASEYKTHHGMLSIDFSLAGFRITRDFLFVLIKRFHSDSLVLLFAHDYEVTMAQSIGLQAELCDEGDDEFKKQFEQRDILAHNLSMLEYLLYEIRRWWAYILFFFSKKGIKKERIIHIHKSSPNLFLMISGLIVSVTLLLFIFHFAVSKTFVHITPQITVRPISANVIYSISSGSILEGKNVFPLKYLTIPVEYTMQFTLDTVDPNSTANSEWIATIYNELNTEQALKPFTRLVTDNGEVFRTKSWVNVPPSRSQSGITEMWSIDVELVADPNDEAWRVIWSRGNIPKGTNLSIPGLKFNRDKVYAKTKDDFTGGSDPRVHVVTETEVAKFKGILHEQLLRVARTELQTKLDGNKKDSWEDYSLLMGDGVSFTWETIDISSGQKYGDVANEISLRWRVSVTAMIYDRAATITYLTEVFRESLLHGTDKELAIHPDTLHMTNIVSRAEDGSRIKVTMEMNASITYDFENVANELTRHMKVLIAGLSQKDAVDRLLNDGHVKEVTIDFSPFWIRQVSSNIDNVEFIIKR